MKVKFKGEEIKIHLGKYSSGQLKLTATDSEGIPYMHITKDATGLGVDLEENEVLIKNYSENEGILTVLQSAKLIGEVKRVKTTTFVKFFVVDLLKIPRG